MSVLKTLKESERLPFLVHDMAQKVKAMLGLPDGSVLDGTQTLPALGLDSLMVMELRNVVKQNTGLASAGYFAQLSHVGRSLAYHSVGTEARWAALDQHRSSNKCQNGDLVNATGGEFFDTSILLRARCGSRGFLVRRDREAAGRGTIVLCVAWHWYDFQEVSDLATHFADEIERLCSTGLIQVGGWSAPSADVWPMRSSCSWFVEVNRGAVYE